MTKARDISRYGLGVGIQSAGSVVTGVGITQLNFIGAGNTFRVSGGTVDISISGGGDSLRATVVSSTWSQVGAGLTFTTGIGTNLTVSGVITATSFVGNVTGTATTTTNIPNLTGAITSVGTATTLGSFSSSNLATALTDETGSGSAVFATSPTLVTPALGTPASGVLSNCTVDGTDAIGFRNIPVNSQSTSYTLVLTDAGKVILHPASDANTRTFTIPDNGSVAYPIGTALTFINMTSQAVTIAITTDTMYLSSAGTTGSRSLAQYGSATAVKITSTNWIISGSGLT